MFKFELYWPVKLVFGPGEFKRAGKEAKLLGKKAFIVTGKSAVQKMGLLDRLVGQLTKEGLEVKTFEKIEPNPRSTTVDEGGKLAKSSGCDLIIALGGGSAMDAAKGIALVAGAPKKVSVWDYVFNAKNAPAIDFKPLPVLMLPTLPATGSESNSIAVITNWELKQKIHITHPLLFPAVSIIDPELTCSLSKEQTAYAGVDIVCHLLEPYLTNFGDVPVKDRLAEDIMLQAIENTPPAMLDPLNTEYRSLMSFAGTIACSPIRFSGWNGKGYLHWIEHCLSAWTDIQHSEGLACLLVAWMKYMKKYEFFAKRSILFGEKVFSDKESAMHIESWLQSLGVNTRLKNITDDLIGKMADTLMEMYSGGAGAIELPSGEKMYRKDFINIYELAAGKKL